MWEVGQVLFLDNRTGNFTQVLYWGRVGESTVVGPEVQVEECGPNSVLGG